MTILVECPIDGYIREFPSIGDANKFYACYENHPESKLRDRHIFRNLHASPMHEIDNGYLETMLLHAREYIEKGVTAVTICLEDYWDETEAKREPTGKYALRGTVYFPEYCYSRDYESDLRAEEALRKEIMSRR